MSDTALTPYDTGARAEPKPWEIRDPEAEPGSVAWSMDQDRYGKVDFTDEEDASIATVWIEKSEHGQSIVHVQQLGAEVLVRVMS